MRIANVILDSYSAVVSLIMLFYLVGGKRKKDRLRRGFILMCAINVLMIIGDLSNWLCECFAVLGLYLVAAASIYELSYRIPCAQDQNSSLFLEGSSCTGWHAHRRLCSFLMERNVFHHHN